MSDLCDVKVTSEPSHKDDISLSWVKIDLHDIHQPEDGSKTVRMGPGTYPVQLYARGRPGAKWKVTLESPTMTFPGKGKFEVALRIHPDSKDAYVPLRLKLEPKKTSKKKAGS